MAMASEATTPEAQGCSDDPALECEVFENQRWKPLVGWTSSMLITDRWSFSDADGRSLDRQQVGLAAARVRLLRKPDPYKGKGIRYVGEVVKLKAGKRK